MPLREQDASQFARLLDQGVDPDTGRPRLPQLDLASRFHGGVARAGVGELKSAPDLG